MTESSNRIVQNAMAATNTTKSIFECPKCGKMEGFHGKCPKCGYQLMGEDAVGYIARKMAKHGVSKVNRQIKQLFDIPGIGRVDLDIGTRIPSPDGKGHGHGMAKMKKFHAKDYPMLARVLVYGKAYAENVPGEAALCYGDYYINLKPKKTRTEAYTIDTLHKNPNKVRGKEKNGPFRGRR